MNKEEGQSKILGAHYNTELEERLERWDLVGNIWNLEIIFMIFFIPIFLKVIIKLLEVSELLKLQNNIREHEKNFFIIEKYMVSKVLTLNFLVKIICKESSIVKYLYDNSLYLYFA